jgi:hypothetical protein
MLHIKRNRKYFLREVFHDIHIVYEGLLMDAGQEMQELSTNTSAGRLIGNDHFLNKLPGNI